MDQVFEHMVSLNLSRPLEWKMGGGVQKRPHI